MKKLRCTLICFLLSLAACVPQPMISSGSNKSEVKPVTPSALSDLPDLFPSIQSTPHATNFGREKLYSVPKYDPNSDQMSQMDLSAYDLSDLDLRNSLQDLLHASFDSQTKWPPQQKMPKDFNWQQIMESGKNPGLGIRQLHEMGITGHGVGIAIIDQPLLVEHQEYVNQLRLYEADNLSPDWGPDARMHGAAVASIAIGKTVGVAPDADLYYIATGMCNNTDYFENNDYSCLAHSVRRVLELNKLLPQDRKIRVISISVGWSSESKGYEEITAATQEAKKAGLLVICSSVEDVHGFQFHALGREPLTDPDKFESYQPGSWWAKGFYDGRELSNALLVPAGSRTTASPGGPDEYAFYREGGSSWAIPYIAGTYALAVQIKPEITPDEFWQLALQTGQTIELRQNGKLYKLGIILDPTALIIELQK